jgi:hypothetical protein
MSAVIYIYALRAMVVDSSGNGVRIEELDFAADIREPKDQYRKRSVAPPRNSKDMIPSLMSTCSFERRHAINCEHSSRSNS